MEFFEVAYVVPDTTPHATYLFLDCEILQLA